ncbi:hypothetical protein Tco_1349672 [Tanacetum coccineum]
MIEEPVKPKKKDVQIMLDKEATKKLQAEFDEEERLSREKDEANVVLTEEWDDIQAKIEADHELAQRLQAEEQEEFSVEEKANLFQQLLEQTRKHFAAKRAEEQWNKPPTKTQQKKTMITYLKNMEELEQESTKKQKVDEDNDTTELQSLMEVIQNEEEVAIDDVPLATKEDLEDLYKLVNAKYKSTRPVEDLDLGRIVGIKSLLNAVSITAALIDVNAAQSKLVLLENFNENYSKCLRLLYKVNAAEGVNAASEEVSTAELVSTAYLKEFDLLKWDQQASQYTTKFSLPSGHDQGCGLTGLGSKPIEGPICIWFSSHIENTRNTSARPSSAYIKGRMKTEKEYRGIV